MFSGRVDRCYDSHVHWLATGEYASRLALGSLSSAAAVRDLKIEPHYFQGQWLIGFGWDQTKWAVRAGGTTVFPNRNDLDQLVPDRPAVFSRADGHVYWVNTKALQIAGLLDDHGRLAHPLPEVPGGKIVVDTEGIPTGIFVDAARAMIDPHLPKPGHLEIRNFLLRAARMFNRAGFTHIRDLSCSPTQWSEALHLAESGLLTLFVDQFISANTPAEFDAALELALMARTQQHPRLQVRGLKVYIDGALGSEGAWISRPYASGSGTGLCLLERKNSLLNK